MKRKPTLIQKLVKENMRKREERVASAVLAIKQLREARKTNDRPTVPDES